MSLSLSLLLLTTIVSHCGKPQVKVALGGWWWWWRRCGSISQISGSAATFWMDALKTKMRQINVKPFVDIMSLPTKLSAVPSCFGVSYLHSLAVCWKKNCRNPYSNTNPPPSAGEQWKTLIFNKVRKQRPHETPSSVLVLAIRFFLSLKDEHNN